MATFFEGESHTFSEYLLVPGYSSAECIPANVSLKTPLVQVQAAARSLRITLNIPMVSAIMQSVSDDKLAVALAKEGGISFIYGSQTVEDEAAMVRRVKSYKAGFVRQRLQPYARQHAGRCPGAEGAHRPLHHGRHRRRHPTRQASGHRDQPRLPRQPHGSRDHKVAGLHDALRQARSAPTSGITLKEANDIIWEHKLNALPIVDEERQPGLHRLPQGLRLPQGATRNELLDSHKRYMVGAGINTRDYARAGARAGRGRGGRAVHRLLRGLLRVAEAHHRLDPRATTATASRSAPATSWTREGFRFLAECRRGLRQGGHRRRLHLHHPGARRASAAARPPRSSRCAEARDEYFEETGVYMPVCSDGGIVHDYHMTLALAMGADFIMLGRYFARFDESPDQQGQRQRQLHEGVLGRGLRPRPQLAALRPGRRQQALLRGGRGLLRPLRRHAARTTWTMTLYKVKLHHVQLRRELTIPELQEKAQAHAGLRPPPSSRAAPTTSSSRTRATRA